MKKKISFFPFLCFSILVLIFCCRLSGQALTSNVEEWILSMESKGYKTASEVLQLGDDPREGCRQLIQGLRHENPLIRKVVAYRIGDLRLVPDLSIPALIECFNDSDDDVRILASIAVSQFGEEAIPYLMKTLSSSEGRSIHLNCYDYVPVVPLMGAYALSLIPETPVNELFQKIENPYARGVLFELGEDYRINPLLSSDSLMSRNHLARLPAAFNVISQGDKMQEGLDILLDALKSNDNDQILMSFFYLSHLEDEKARQLVIEEIDALPDSIKLTVFQTIENDIKTKWVRWDSNTYNTKNEIFNRLLDFNKRFIYSSLIGIVQDSSYKLKLKTFNFLDYNKKVSESILVPELKDLILEYIRHDSLELQNRAYEVLSSYVNVEPEFLPIVLDRIKNKTIKDNDKYSIRNTLLNNLVSVENYKLEVADFVRDVLINPSMCELHLDAMDVLLKVGDLNSEDSTLVVTILNKVLSGNSCYPEYRLVKIFKSLEILTPILIKQGELERSIELLFKNPSWGGFKIGSYYLASKVRFKKKENQYKELICTMLTYATLEIKTSIINALIKENTLHFLDCSEDVINHFEIIRVNNIPLSERFIQEEENRKRPPWDKDRDLEKPFQIRLNEPMAKHLYTLFQETKTKKLRHEAALFFYYSQFEDLYKFEELALFYLNSDKEEFIKKGLSILQSKPFDFNDEFLNKFNKLTKHPSNSIKLEALKSLKAANQNIAPHIPVITFLLKNKDHDLRASAIDVLGEWKVNDPQTRIVYEGNTKFDYYDSDENWWQRNKEKTLFTFGHNDKDEIRVHTKFGLISSYSNFMSSIDKTAINILTKALSDENWRVRNRALFYLGLVDSASPSIVNAIKKAVEEKSFDEHILSQTLFNLGLEDVFLLKRAIEEKIEKAKEGRRGLHISIFENNCGPNSGPRSKSLLPFLPWPPPQATVRGMVPGEILGKSSDSLLTVFNNLTKALNEVGYKNYRIYRVSDGFALLTKLERINADASPFEDVKYRWVEGVIPPLNLKEYLKNLLFGVEGNYRVLVFIVTPLSFFPDNGRPLLTSTSVKNLYKAGGFELPKDISSKSFKDMYVHCLVYQFYKRNGGTANILYDSPLEVNDHLLKTGVYEALKQN